MVSHYTQLPQLRKVMKALGGVGGGMGATDVISQSASLGTHRIFSGRRDENAWIEWRRNCARTGRQMTIRQRRGPLTEQSTPQQQSNKSSSWSPSCSAGAHRRPRRPHSLRSHEPLSPLGERARFISLVAPIVARAQGLHKFVRCALLAAGMTRAPLSPHIPHGHYELHTFHDGAQHLHGDFALQSIIYILLLCTS